MQEAGQDPVGHAIGRTAPLRGNLRGHTLPFWGLLAFALWSPVSIAGANISYGVAIFLCAFQAYLNRGRAGARVIVPARTALDRGFALYLFASFLAVCVSLDPLASLNQYLSLIKIVIFYLFAWTVKSRREVRTLVGAWFGACALAGAYGTLQCFTGWDAFGHYDPRVNKIGGFFSMHLTFSEYLLMGLCMSAGVLLWARPESRARRACLRAAFGIMLLGFLLARAKGAYFGLLAGMGVIGALKGRRTLAVMGAVVAAPLALLAAWNAQGLYDHFLSEFLVDAQAATGWTHSNTQRLFMWWTGFRISLGHFLNGVGLHAVGVLYPEFRHELATAPNQWHLHSNFVHLGVTRGLFGLSAFLYIFLLACRNGLARFRDPASDPWDRALAAGALGACAAFLVAGLTEYSWGDSEVLMGFLMVLGLSVAVPAGKPGGKDRPSRFPSTGEAGRSSRGGSSRGSARSAALVDEEPVWVRTGFAVLLVLACLGSLVFTPPTVNTGTRVLQAALGLVLCGTAGAALLLRSTAARRPGRAGTFPDQGAVTPPNTSTGDRDSFRSLPEGRLSPERLAGWLLSPAFSKTVACIVTLAGYTFTRRLWESGVHGFAGPWFSEWVVILPSFLGLLLAILLSVRRRPHGGWGLFDAAIVGAAGVWAVQALGTGILLRLASSGQGPLSDPFPCVLLLSAFTASLYLSTRLLSSRGPVPDALQALLGAAMVARALW